MSSVNDNWERLVQATLRREHDREIAYCESFSSRTSDSSSRALGSNARASDSSSRALGSNARASDLSSRDLDSNFESFREDVASGTQEQILELVSSGHNNNNSSSNNNNSSSSSSSNNKKRLQLQTVSMKVRMDCPGCERKVKNALSTLKGVKSVEIDRRLQKVTVTGYIEQDKVLKRAKSTGKNAEIWPYVPYNLVAHPYAPQAYEKKDPPGFVRKVENPPTTGPITIFEDPNFAIYMFSDDNPNACSIM